jgi:shikimate kinase
MTHLVLVGMMGTGKSTVGRIVAERLGVAFHDTDDLVEQRAGRSVRDLFRDEGEDAFRRLETEVLVDALAAEEPAVVAAAGGVVLRPENRAALAAADARVVWLCAEPETLLERVRNGMHRPLLDDDPEGTLRRMHADREPLYREVADAIVSVDHRSIHEVVEAVLR